MKSGPRYRYTVRMNVEILALCDFAQDASGKLTVLGAFDAITVREFPSVHQLLCVAARVRFQVYELGAHAMRIDLVDASGDRLAPPLEGSMHVNGIGGDSACANLALNVFNLRLEREGSWRLVLSIDGQERASTPLYVRKAASRARRE
ncbi:MAG: hypothetical protein CVV47_14370 [Spirochaetae bacterium HGW-Spirochaetae-3]|nr:MAG: hypothetical protein CVV47_14370 [Spirochaetae bacterium HGW-Spirochaetae-3]